jgi:hypothetical protein
MTVDRLAKIGIFIALLTLGAVIVSLFAGLQQLVSHPIAAIGSIALGTIMVYLMVKVALTAERRTTGWTRRITSPNGKWLFLILIVLWVAAMTFMASLGLGGLQIGGLALVMLFVGFFLFMGFIWAVIGE